MNPANHASRRSLVVPVLPARSSRPQRSVSGSTGAATNDIAHHIVDEKGILCRDDSSGRRRLRIKIYWALDQGRLRRCVGIHFLAPLADEIRIRCVQEFTVGIFDSLNKIGVDLVTTVRECGVAVDEIERRDSASAQRKRRIGRQRSVVKPKSADVLNRGADAGPSNDPYRDEIQ